MAPAKLPSRTSVARSPAGRKASLKLDSSGMKRGCVEVLDIVKRLRQEFEGNRKLDLLGNWQWDFFARRAIEIAQSYKPVDHKNCGQSMVMRFLDRARGDVEMTRIASSS
jgi:hypothetical protein